MYGLLGKSLKHSFSKSIHGSLGFPSYQLIETSDLSLFFDTTDFQGLNVTIPYKEAVIEYCNELDPIVQRTNSCNTIVKNENMLYAYNTDYYGFQKSLTHHNISIAGKSVAIIGNGATSRTVRAVVEDLNAKDILRFARTPIENDKHLSEISSYNNINILINTTPVGMYPQIDSSLPIDLSSFPNLQSVIDVVYNPLQTNFLLDAKHLGLQTMNGLYMLVAQAVKSYELFHKKLIKDTTITSIYRHLRKSQTNIVFIGMPKSGKSLYSKIYSEKSNRKIYDIDNLFEERFNITIKDYFEQVGEEQFRDEERKLIEEVSSTSGTIISTGGGAILDARNIRNLKRNGLVIFIDAPLDMLERTGVSNHRPLLKNTQSLEALYHKRYAKYLEAADIVFKKTSLTTTTNMNGLEVLIYEYFGT